jgi:hypothetical protein
MIKKLYLSALVLACIVSVSSAISFDEMNKVVEEIWNTLVDDGYNVRGALIPADNSYLNITVKTNQSDQAALAAASLYAKEYKRYPEITRFNFQVNETLEKGFAKYYVLGEWCQNLTYENNSAGESVLTNASLQELGKKVWGTKVLL